jgi:hypothetical protein
MEANPDEVISHDAERHTCSSGDLAHRETAAEEVSHLVHKRYLKRKQQRSLVAG